MLSVISSYLQFLCLCTASIASVAVAVFVSAVWPNFIYPITKKGRKPSKRHPLIWVGFWLSLVTAACSGAFAVLIPPVVDVIEPAPTPVVQVPITVIPPTVQVTINQPPASSLDGADATDEAEGFPIGQQFLDGEKPLIAGFSSPVLLKINRYYDKPAYSLLFPPTCMQTLTGLQIEPQQTIDAGVLLTLPKPAPSYLVSAYVRLNEYKQFVDAIRDMYDIQYFQIGTESATYQSEVYQAYAYDNPFKELESKDGLHILPSVTVQPYSSREWVWHSDKMELTQSSEGSISFFFPLHLETFGVYHFTTIFQVESGDGTIYLVGSPAVIYFGPSVQENVGLGVDTNWVYELGHVDDGPVGLAPCP